MQSLCSSFLKAAIPASVLRHQFSRFLPLILMLALTAMSQVSLEATAWAQAKPATQTKLTVTSSGNVVTSVPSGSVVTLTAAVQAGAAPLAQGTVNFCDASAKYCTDIHLLGSAQITTAGTAAMKLRPGLGSHSYKAVFAGTNTYAGSSSGASPLSVTGKSGPFATSATIAQTGSWGAYNLSATVTEIGGAVAPTGTVSFLDSSSGNAVLGQGTLGAATPGYGWVGASSPGTLNDPRVFAIADFNGDGVPDLAIVNYSSSCYLCVFLANGDGTFTAAASNPSVNFVATAITVADFNGDGIPDLALVNNDQNTITILLGKGDGTFTTLTTTPAAGQAPTAIVAGDFNGDGILDLAVTDWAYPGNGTVTILLGNGDGTFTAASSSSPATVEANHLVAADFNGDGKLDLAITSETDDSLAILLGNGDGTFASPITVQTGGEGYALAAADLNGDGIPDLVVGGFGSSMSVLLGNGDGTFTAAPVIPGQSDDVAAVAIADFNGDGIPDIAFSSEASLEGVFVYLGIGDGTFTAGPPLPQITYSPSVLVAADLNGDGRTDLLIPGASGNLQTYLGEPTETATASANVAVTTAGQHLVDANYLGDSNYNASLSGTLPLWGAPPSTSTTLAISAGGKVVSSVAPGTVVTLSATVKSGTAPVTSGQVNFCDASTTSCTDIHLLATVFLSSAGTASYEFVPGPGTQSYKAEYVQSGDGLTSSSSAASLKVGPAPAPVYTDIASIASGGFPGDYSLTATVEGLGGTAAPTGNVSFLDTSFSNHVLGTAALGSSQPGIGWLISQTAASGAYPVAEVTADFNRDGIPDLAVLWSNSSYDGALSITIFTGKGDGTFTAGTSISTGISDQIYPYMVVGDFNGDGKPDLAVLSWSTVNNVSYVTTLLGNGDGAFASPQSNIAFNQGVVGGDGVPGSMVAGDFNGDGKLDLAVVGDYIAPGGVTVLLGNGDGTFKAGTTFATSQDFGLIATGDFNGDGIPDLVVTNYFEFGGGPTIFLGKGDGTFTAKTTSFSLDYFPTSVVVGDFNGDGIQDLAFSDLNGVEIALGNGDGTFKETSASPMAVSELYSLVAGNFNHDGKLDLAGIDNYNDQIDLFLGKGDGTFTKQIGTPNVSSDWLGPFAIVAADFNGDGVSDLAMLTKSTSTASILLTEPTQTATATVNNIAPVGAAPHNVQASYAGDSKYPSSSSPTVTLQPGLAPLVVTPAAGAYTTAQTITITESVPGATIYYQASGIINTNGFVPYTGPIQLNEGGSLFIGAYAAETGYQQASETYANYVINLPPAPAPTISPAAGTYASAPAVTIADSANGATIYYTTDGTAPTNLSAVYSSPIPVPASEVVAAAAIAPGYSLSAPAVAQYLISSSSTPYIYNFAGNGVSGYAGDGGPATAAYVSPEQAVADSAGNVYIADESNFVIRKVAAHTGIITTFAGAGVSGSSGDGGLATSATFGYIANLALDSAGNVYLCDYSNAVVRKIAAGTGIISTIAGNGSTTVSGDGGPATAAGLGSPVSLAVDGSGNVYIGGNNVVREVSASTGNINTLAGTGSYGYSGDGGPATAATFYGVDGIAADAAGDVYIADANNDVIRSVSAATGIISTVAGTKPAGGYSAGGFGGDGGPAIMAQLNWPESVALDGAGNLYIADYNNLRIREVSAASGLINTVAGDGNWSSLSGDGAPARSVALYSPYSVSSDSAGNLYVVSYSGTVRLITSPQAPPTSTTAAPVFSVGAGTYAGAQTVSITSSTPEATIYVTLDGTAPTTLSQIYNGPINVTGNLTIKAISVAPGYLTSAPVSAAYTITTPPTALVETLAGSGASGFSGQGGPALSAQFGYPAYPVFDAAGNLYFSDTWNNVVWMVAAGTGKISVVAGNGTAGKSGNGGAATSASLNQPEGLAVDAAGNLYIADSHNYVVRVVSATTGVITTYAGNGVPSVYGNNGDGGPATSASLTNPVGLAIDSAGNLYISDSAVSVVRKVAASTGIITTYAGNPSATALGDGGPATSAQLQNVGALAIDSAGNLYLASGYRVRKITASTGVINTVAGNGSGGVTGDGGLAVNAELEVSGLAVDSTGNLYIANNPDGIRKVDASTGIISRIAGDGYWGYNGDGNSATVTSFYGPVGLTIDSLGNIVFADSYNFRIREVVFPIAPAITWATPAPITYGTALGSAQLNATAPVPGKFVYSPAAGTVLGAGSQTLSVTFAPTDKVDYTPVTASVTLKVNQAQPVITWPTPAAILSGTALSATQLDATASVPGAFVYSPAAGTVPPVGNNTLSTTFTPTDTTDYTTANASVILAVNTSNPAPVLTSISPAFTSAGSTGINLSVTGTAFQSNSVVYWGATALTTQFTSATELSAQVPASAIASAGMYNVTVQTPTPGGGASSALVFEVDSAGSGSGSPSFGSLTATVSPGASATYPVTLPASASEISAACYNLPAGATCSYSASTGAVTVTTSATTPTGSYQITVVFNETLPGAASGLLLAPFLLLPLAYFNRKRAKSLWMIAGMALVLAVGALCATGCGGGGSQPGGTTNPTHQITSSGVVKLIVQ